MLSRFVRTSTSRRSLAPDAPTNQKSDPGCWHGTLAIPEFTPSSAVVVLVPTVPAASGPVPSIDSGSGFTTTGLEPMKPRFRIEPTGLDVAGSGAIVRGWALPVAVGVPSGSVGDTPFTTLASLPPAASTGHDSAVRFTTVRAGSVAAAAGLVSGFFGCVTTPSPASTAMAAMTAPSRRRGSD